MKKPLLYGLVLAGGRSSRMKQDKSLLHYHGKSQVAHCFELLSGLCQEVYLSNRKEQSALKGHREFPQIHDKFIGIGPLGGILSAMMHKPAVAWLVLACDLPFIDHLLLTNLVACRAIEKYATAYTSAHHPGELEPLCAIYEPKLMPCLQEHMQRGIYCPKKILSDLDIAKLVYPDANSLDNVNSEDDYKNAIQRLNNNDVADIWTSDMPTKTPKLKIILALIVIALFMNSKPLAAFNGNDQGQNTEFYSRINSYLAHRFLVPETSGQQTLARLGRTRFINRDFHRKVHSRPNFNKRLQKELSKEFRDLRAHKRQRSVGRRFKVRRVAERQNLLAEGRRAFQDTLRDRLQNRPQNRFREQLRNRFQKQNNGPRVKRSDARRHR